MNRKSSALIALVFGLAVAPLATFAEVSVQLSNVHICCDSCVKGVAKAVAPVTGITAVASKDDETVTITAPDQATAQKAVDALITAGYFGTSNNPAIKVAATTGASDAKVQSLMVDGVHLCCKKCVTAVNNAVSKVPGVKTSGATKDAASFEVTGDFKPADVFNNLQEAGLTGKAGKAK